MQALFAPAFIFLQNEMFIKYLSLAIFLLAIPVHAFTQKPQIDSTLYRNWDRADFSSKRLSNWESVENPVISPDGQYMAYTHSGKNETHSLVLTSTDGNWRHVFSNAFFNGFSKAGHFSLLTFNGDSLSILNLASDKILYRTQGRSAQLLNNDDHDLVTWRSFWDLQKQIIFDLTTGEEKEYHHVVGIFQNGRKVNLIIQEKNEIVDSVYTFKWKTLGTDSIFNVYQGKQANNFIFSPDNVAVTFKTTESMSPGNSSIWFFREGMPKAEKMLDGTALFQDEHVLVDRILRFSKDASLVFMTVKEGHLPAKSSTSPATIWSYQDKKLRSLQDKSQSENIFYSVISLSNHRYIRLTDSNESTQLTTLRDAEHDNIALVDHRNDAFDQSESEWNKAGKGIEYLLYPRTGERINIASLSGSNLHDFRIDPTEKFVVYYNRLKGDFISYEIATKKSRNITWRIKTDWEQSDIEYPQNGSYTNAFTGWVKGGRYVLLHDRYDIWQVDLLGLHQPINVTNGFGRKKRIVFRLAINSGKTEIQEGDTTLLSAFNKTNKDNGFYSIILGERANPQIHSMGPCFYEAPGNYQAIDGMEPLKAKNVNIYIVKRMSATDAPNYFSTRDFRTFIRLSNVQPAKEYNWYTTEVFHYKGLDRTPLNGLLYKPENFDPHKKYPVIFHYYEKLADRKNVYLQPEFASGPIDIPTYVSNGYLVVTPNIRYSVGSPGQSAVNSVIAAAKYISKRPYVDAKHMGIQGHSFGGYETYFIVTHSHLFAAACASSGITDLISNSLSISPKSGNSWQSFFEISQGRLGISFGSDPKIYVRNSPIFYVKNLATPLLMMHTTNDGIVPFPTAIEFFTAARREGKKIWLLQYDASHSLDNLQQAKDYTLRLRQFFDHYLKETPAPIWMTGTKE